MATHQFIGVTAHGITEGWHLESFLINLIPVKEAETAEYIAKRICETLQDWGISNNNIISPTTDGASIIQSAVTKQLHFPWVWCLAHCLHLIVVKGNFLSLSLPLLIPTCG